MKVGSRFKLVEHCLISPIIFLYLTHCYVNRIPKAPTSIHRSNNAWSEMAKMNFIDHVQEEFLLVVMLDTEVVLLITKPPTCPSHESMRLYNHPNRDKLQFIPFDHTY